MSGPENPQWERWDAAARRPEDVPTVDRPASQTAEARFALAAATAGLLAAVALPGNRLGIGVLVVAVALAVAARFARAEAPGRRVERWVWGGAALLLVSAAVLRDAAWVVVPALLGALALGSLAVAGGRTWAGVGRGLVAAVVRSPRGPGLVVRGAISAVPAGSAPPLRPIARGAGLAAILLTVFGVLFVTGDAAFAQLAVDTLPTTRDADVLVLRAVVLVAAVALAGGLALARLAGPRDHAGPPRRRLASSEWLVALVALDLLVAAFVGVQLAVLFGDERHVLTTAGLTYAEYARAGFVQLLVAAALTLAVAGAALRWSPPGRRTAIRAALGVLCALTLVVLASALHRLDLYQDAYGATRLRLAAHAGILLTGALLALVLGALAIARFAWLPRAVTATVALALAGFVAVNPDLRIAERNLARAEVDEAYLRELSADAAPALPRRLVDRPEPDGLFGWNLARRHARAVPSSD